VAFVVPYYSVTPVRMAKLFTSMQHSLLSECLAIIIKKQKHFVPQPAIPLELSNHTKVEIYNPLVYLQRAMHWERCGFSIAFPVLVCKMSVSIWISQHMHMPQCKSDVNETLHHLAYSVAGLEGLLDCIQIILQPINKLVRLSFKTDFTESLAALL